MKYCTLCKNEKEDSDFYPSLKTKPRTYCKECYKYKMYERTYFFKQKCVDYKGGKCQNCGYNKCISALDFHHKDPSQKDFGISQSRTKRFDDKVKNELDKCDLLCSNCHREEHSNKLIPTKVDKQLKINDTLCLCGNTKYYESKTCNKCYQTDRQSNIPSKEELEKLIWEMPSTKIALKFNVSDKSIEKWCKKYQIIKPQRGYWQKQK